MWNGYSSPLQEECTQSSFDVDAFVNPFFENVRSLQKLICSSRAILQNQRRNICGFFTEISLYGFFFDCFEEWNDALRSKISTISRELDSE